MTLSVTTPTPPARTLESLSGDVRIVAGTFTFSSSYPTGGEAFDLQAAIPAARAVIVISVTPAGGYTFQWVAGTKKLKAFTTATTEAAPATNLSTLGPIPYVAYVR